MIRRSKNENKASASRKSQARWLATAVHLRLDASGVRLIIADAKSHRCAISRARKSRLWDRGGPGKAGWMNGMPEGRTNLLILGSGAREHALARACAKSPMTGNLFVAPGNPGCATIAQTVPLRLTEHANVIAFCQRESIDLVVVGPEAPLVSGVADDLKDAGISCFGPTQNAARLEGSKGYAKDFCREF